MKEIKDYLHLYLGCECMMVINSYHAVHELKLSKDTPFRLRGSHVDYFTDKATKAHIKPILRPLSDMTEEEAREIAGIMGINASVDDELKVKRVKNEIMVWNTTDYGDDWDEADNNDAGVLIDLKTHLFSNNINEGDYHRVPDFITHANMFRYMLSKSFDLFGLIKSGLAISKTQTQEQ